MKKVIVTVCLVGMATIAAQAQGVGTVKLINYEAKQYQPHNQSIGGAVDRAAIKARREHEAKSAQDTAAKPAAKKNNAGKSAKPAKQTAPRTQQAKKENATLWDYFKAYALGRRLPNETSERYHTRMVAMGYPCNQPFK